MGALNEPNRAATLRRRAEAQLRENLAKDDAKDAQSWTLDEIRRELHELSVHQIELEIQNEELHRIQQDLEHVRSRYFDLYDLAPLGYCTIDDTGIVVEANLTLGTLLGHVRSVVVDRRFSQFIHCQDQDLFYLFQRNALEAGMAQSCDLRLARNGGEIFWAHLDAVTMIDSRHNKTIRMMVTDISERKLAEQERDLLRDRIHNTEKLEAVGVLVAGVAHNMNNVLGVIMGASSQQESKTNNPNDAETYAIITKACQKGREVVRSLVQFIKPNIVNKVSLLLQEQLRELGVLLQNTTRGRIRIEEAFCEEPMWILGDTGSISSALMNLCLNAIDAMPNGGRLLLGLEPVGLDHVQVVVEDNGEGISSKNLARVMEPFFTTKAVGKGTGLGLCSAHGVVKAHGGTLGISSTPGIGTTVKLLLPTVPAPVEWKRPQPVGRSEGLNILVVDDDEDVRQVAVAMLEALGHSVRSTSGGVAALDLIRAGMHPDLVVLDQNMPGMDGEETYRKIRLLDGDLLVLFSSGQLDVESMACVREPRVSAIQKPFSMDELGAKIVQMRLEIGK